jgi:hypothetical protein
MQSSLAFGARRIGWTPDRINWSMTQTGTSASFSIDSVCVHVVFEQHEPDVWIVSFDAEEHELEQAFTLALHIFDGVMIAVREFLESREPNTLVFPTTQQKGLADAYEVYLQREERHLEMIGYKLEMPKPMERVIEFRLRRMAFD